jgi:hypothetical protein
VDVSALKDAAEVGLIAGPAFQPLDRGRLVAEGFKKGLGKTFRIKWLLREPGNGFFDFNGVHGCGEMATFSGPGECL